MPYRRLPNTDQSRLRALQKAINESSNHPNINDVPISFKYINEASVFLNNFQNLLRQYKQALDDQVGANKNYQHIVHNARIYISHFIQVLNLAVTRGEIKAEHKTFYGLNPEDFTVPDLSKEAAIMEWGKKLIDGECQRMQNGGAPMYNPSIANVRVHYDVFVDYKENQHTYQHSTNTYLDKIATMRAKGDEIIQNMWNEVEQRFADLPPYDRLFQCQKYGLVYYYRRGETRLTPEDNNVAPRVDNLSI